tara:strand:+ start:145 stop:417 length:273 start_codon:yes stop_codon:yes gene_type:complete
MPNTNAITKVNLAFEELKSRLMISSPNPISKLSGVLGINQSSNPSDIPINADITNNQITNIEATDILILCLYLSSIGLLIFMFFRLELFS